MHKKFLRILSSALLIVMLFTIFPTTASAAGTEVDEICAKIKETYHAAQRGAGRHSFDGYCGTMVSWYIHSMGITSELVFGDGNIQYDIYRGQKYTSGNFRVHDYPLEQYSLTEALNAITENGTQNAYNILVGFDRTTTMVGRQFGHACFIHAILDGIVYFSESFPIITNGRYYPEGTPIALTIDQFEEFYSTWAVYEGTVHFDLKTYAESCTYYPSHLIASASADTVLYSEPCVTEVDERSLPLSIVPADKQIRVIGLYQNPDGEYWYQAEFGPRTGYVQADKVQVVSLCYDDVTIEDIDAPTELNEGYSYFVKGKIKSAHNLICTVRAQVFSYDDDSFSHEIITTASLDDYNYSLYYSRISNDLTFRLLKKGAYRYELAAVIGNNYYEDGCLQTEWKTQMLWVSDFKVV